MKNLLKLIWNVQKGFDFETDKTNAHFKILLKIYSKCTENAVWLKCISKHMHFKTAKSDVAKRTVSKQMYFKTDGKDQPNEALMFLNECFSDFFSISFYFDFSVSPTFIFMQLKCLQIQKWDYVNYLSLLPLDGGLLTFL